eukprot:1140658-Pelagomonas_calceolata.AAC.2
MSAKVMSARVLHFANHVGNCTATPAPPYQHAQRGAEDPTSLSGSQINTRMRDAEDTERAINTAREVYRTVPVRGSILYFVIADLAGIDPMYQYSLSYFASLFNQCISAAAPSSDLPTRLESLLNYITEFMYKMVSAVEGPAQEVSSAAIIAAHRKAGELLDQAVL